MPTDFLYSPLFLLSIATCLAIMVFVAGGALLRRKLTRPIVIIIGLAFIGAGVLGHITILNLEVNGKELVGKNLLSASLFANFTRYKEVFAYFFPAISAAIGTNVISDALLKHHTYES